MTRLLRHRSVPIVALLAFMVLVAGQVLAQETSATDLMTRANERYERGEYAEAAQQYEALIDLGYSDTALYFNLGNAYLESGDLGRAILNYMRARELSPRRPGRYGESGSGARHDGGPHRERARLSGRKPVLLRVPLGDKG